HHVTGQHHAEIARTSDDDLPVHAKRELASLVLARDEAEREARTIVHGFGAGNHGSLTSCNNSKILVLKMPHAQANGGQSVAGVSSLAVSSRGRTPTPPPPAASSPP